MYKKLSIRYRAFVKLKIYQVSINSFLILETRGSAGEMVQGVKVLVLENLLT